MSKFLIVVDTQRDFMYPDGALYVSGADTFIPAANSFLRNLDAPEYSGVLFTMDTHTPEEYTGSPESEMFGPHCVKGTDGWTNVFDPEYMSEAFPIYYLEKGVFNMWEEPGLQIYPTSGVVNSYDHTCGLQGDEEGIDRDQFFQQLLSQGMTIQVFGVASDYCVKWAVDGLIRRGFTVEVIDDLCRGISTPASEVFAGSEYQQVRIV
jgi:nicotinamidase/pyrazinamidase